MRNIVFALMLFTAHGALAEPKPLAQIVPIPPGEVGMSKIVPVPLGRVDDGQMFDETPFGRMPRYGTNGTPCTRLLLSAPPRPPEGCL